jgi:hypothetical protein
MPGIEGAECEDHDECKAGELGVWGRAFGFWISTFGRGNRDTMMG